MDFEYPGIVGAGGGLKSALQVGYLLDLLPFFIRKLGKNLKLHLSGVSAGALNLSILAQARNSDDLRMYLDRLVHIWMTINREGPGVVFPLGKRALVKSRGKNSLLDGKTLWNLIDGKIGNVPPLDPRLIVNSPITEYCVILRNATLQRQEIFSSKDPRFKERPEEFGAGIVASASIGPFFPQVSIGGMQYSDGNFIDLRPAINAGCDLIFVLMPYRKGEKVDYSFGKITKYLPWILVPIIDGIANVQELDEREIKVAVEISEHIEELEAIYKEVLTLASSEDEIKLIDFFRLKLRASKLLKNKKVPMIVPVIPGEDLRNIKMYDFQKGDIARLIDYGQRRIAGIREDRGLVD